MLFHFVVLFIQSCVALRFDPAFSGYNLNENQAAVHPRDYWGEWDNHTYNKSPETWRFPFYALTIDRFVDGDPTNNDANGTVFEHHWLSNQFRFGGDAAGIQDNLDYLQGMGIKAIYLTGSMMINMPWSADGYGPLDLTLLDQHHGAIVEWRALIDDIHSRGMYVIFDTTISTMGNLLGYEGKWMNTTVEFSFDEYDMTWKLPQRRYHDFEISNDRNESCEMPQIWEGTGYLESQSIMDQYHGCRLSDFDQYGDIKSTGAYDSYINQFSRFASVQDRLREWRPDVLEKINVFSCMQISMLDIDGFRVDKAVQVTVDALTAFSEYQRNCAKQFGKENFLVVGEVVADPKLASIYFGRGMQPDQALENPSQAVFTSQETNTTSYTRAFGLSPLDGAAFDYDLYGSMTRFLGLDSPWGSLGVDWVEMWNSKLATQDLVNANTGVFDPRHLFGMTNQDVFRWPALANGTQRQLLGFFVTILEMPGIPMLFFGEEQEFYALENTAADYVFGRTPMASNTASQIHGCYQLGQKVYVDMPYDRVKDGCHDNTISLDHRDPSHPLRNILKRMFELRQQYPVLNDGFNLTTLSTRLHDIHLRGSGDLPSPMGLWSVYRGRSAAVQDLNATGHGNLPVWLVFHNENSTVTYDFECRNPNTTSEDSSIIAPFPDGTTVKNLFYPYDTYTLTGSAFNYTLEGSDQAGGCIPEITFLPWEFKAFVPEADWEQPKPVITTTYPTHDQRMLSTVAYDQTETVRIEIGFSEMMDCDSVTNSLTIASTTQLGITATLNTSSVACVNASFASSGLIGEVPTVFSFSAELNNVANGVHTFTVNNATMAGQNISTEARDRFMFRIGATDNPMVFIRTANYTSGILHKVSDSGELFVSPRAAGADMMRYSTNWGSSWSKWLDYTGQMTYLDKQDWSGTKDQEWDGDHVILQYWSSMTGSTDHVQHSDLGRDSSPPRRWPHAWVEGIWNQWGYDAGIKNAMSQDSAGEWTFNLFSEWPTNVTINVWGINPDGQPDKSAAYGDVDGDGVLDWLPPDSIASNVINISTTPPQGYIGWKLVVNDGNYSYSKVPYGSATVQIIVAVLLSIIPVLTAILGVSAFMGAFYKVKFNKAGTQAKSWSSWSIPGMGISISFKVTKRSDGEKTEMLEVPPTPTPDQDEVAVADDASWPLSTLGGSDAGAGTPRRKVLIATMEYEIEEWAVKIKIGGLGVMASLMGKNLAHQDLIWVVPCCGGIEYPFAEDSNATPMEITIMNEMYTIDIHYHVVKNITFVLLDAPIFRERTKAEPYPPRMDDLESGIYYSAWNQCIAETIRRFKPDLYHINDYHGACAPLYLLPEVIPCCLSLHNAEFQGLWSLRSAQQMQTICGVFNLSVEVVREYVQFGNVFNLLHAGARYLHIHQKGFGAVGVSKKYGVRSRERYAIFWCLDNIDALPNPDPTDLAPFDREDDLPRAKIDIIQEKERQKFRCEAQKWAGLTVDPKAELFVFVGRWSQQKGVDLIADVFPSVLKAHPKAQLIAVGPVIDLYGKFAALKLEKLMTQYPGRVYSKPEFTALPSCIFSGAEFALMPSRDEPFGLVAVEFGRKGALCVGSRVGGFGHMPGWWFTVESVTSKHLISQFNGAITAALSANYHTRALMRASSKLQRFPVSQWVEDLEKLQSKSIELSSTCQSKEERMPRLMKRGSQYFLSRLKSSSSSFRGSSMMTSPPPSPGFPWETNSISSGPGNSNFLSIPGSSAASTIASSVPGSSAASTIRNVSNSSAASTIRNFSRPGSPADVNEPPSRTLLARRGGSLASLSTPNSLASRNSSPTQMAIGASQFDFLRPDYAHSGNRTYSMSNLSTATVATAHSETALLQNSTPIFLDSKNAYYNHYSSQLDRDASAAILGKQQAPESMLIEEYLIESEKDWFNKYHQATLSPRTPGENPDGEFHQLLGEGYKRPSWIRVLMQRKIGSWYIYSYLLALGQILSASSLQLTIIEGAVGQSDKTLYILCAIYAVSSICWWFMYRRLKAIYVLAAPYFCFGVCFFLIGMVYFAKTGDAKGWLFRVGSWFYTVGSSAGSLFFTLNFGTEGGTPPQEWALRACIITGTQQLLIAFLWFWVTSMSNTAVHGYTTLSNATLIGVTIPLALAMFVISIVLFLGLPDYYRQNPGDIPSFYKALCKKHVVQWFWVMVILQGYWISTTASRSWTFLWSSHHAPSWAIALLVILFFVLIWSGTLAVLAHLTKQHSWIIPIFAIGLGAPAWCQTLWGISGIGNHVPFAGLVGGAILSRCVWLWLGVLYAIQGVGFGMILLMTLTRLHIAFVFIMAQMIGSAITILARATSPSKLGAGEVYINIAGDSVLKPWFWVSLICQLIICVGYFKFFRKAQLQKP